MVLVGSVLVLFMARGVLSSHLLVEVLDSVVDKRLGCTFRRFGERDGVLDLP